MGIHGIYKEIGPGERIALSKLAVEKFEQTGRPLRIAIDTSIWLFQIQSSKGGTNPALRTFYYRLLRLLSLSIHPLFIFDGPNKPPFKRNKKTGPNVASIPEFLAKQLLKQFGFPFHIAPGEAEAECALLQREEIVDAVLSEDVDTLMFGSIISLRSWTPEGKSSKVATHVNLYDAKKTKAGSAGLDREGMILVALMSGGDYLPEGIPGCGPKTACEAARAGFGRRLCKIAKRDTVAIKAWKEDLAHELHTNESKFFRRKHSTLTIPDDFPRMDILGYYTNPAISSADALARLRSNLRWDQDLNFPELRTFTADAFDWIKVGGAKKFVRNLAPALLVRQLRMRGQRDASTSTTEEETQAEEDKLVTGIHGKRQHPSTDNTPELRIAFKPIDIVNIDLDAEEPDDEIETETDPEDEDVAPGDEDAPKKRGPSTYDPTQVEKIWILESYVKVGIPLKVEDWEEAQRKKVAGKRAPASKAAKARRTAPKSTASSGMQFGALDRFARVTKVGDALPQTAAKEDSTSAQPSRPVNPDGPESQPNRGNPSRTTSRSTSKVPRDTSNRPRIPPSTSLELECIDLSESPPISNLEKPKTTRAASDEHYLSPNVTKRQKNFRRTRTMPADLTDDLPSELASDSRICPLATDAGDLLRSSPLPEVPASLMTRHDRDGRPSMQTTAANPRARTPPPRRKCRQATVESEVMSPSRRQMTLFESFDRSKSVTPKKPRYKSTLDIPAGIESFDLTSSSPPRPNSPPAADSVISKCLDPRSEDPNATHRVRNRAKDSSKQTLAQRRVLGDTSGNFLAQTRPRKLPFSAKASEPSISSSVGVAQTMLSEEATAPARRSPRQRKQAVKLRESLEGSWKFVDVEEVDMTGEIGAGSGSGKDDVALALNSRKRSAWRTSEVEMLDLTNE